MYRRFLLISVIAILLLVSVASVFHLGKREKAGEGAPSILSDNETKTLPPISLRGFGKVSGEFEISDSGAGFLTITCQDAEHANLLQAKYLSDLNAILPANRRMMSLHSGQLEIHELAGLGVAAAVRRDSQVYLLAAADEENLKAVVEKNREIPQTLELSQAGTKVPMFLDRWDKFGFRFYYRPFERPKDTAAANYDPLGEFAFAEKMGPTGLIFWANIDQNDSSEGLTNEAWWEWAFDEARKRDLPVGIATMLNSPASAWFYNRFRGEMMQKMPQYMGTFYRPGEKILSSNGFLSFNSVSASTFNLSAMQEILRRKATASNVVTVLEPHGELRHGPHEIFLEYGPTADAGYQTFLQEKYRSISALNQAWGAQFGSWKQVLVPEVASFLGWGPQALDLTGAWRIGYEPLQGEGADLEKLNAHDIARKLQGILPTKGAPREWFAENFDDSAWPQIVAPGDDRALFLESRPAVYRRNFDLPADWLTPKKKIWLYVWDLNSGTGDKVTVAINGKPAGQSTLLHTIPHWDAFDVTKHLREGNNQLSIRLPKGSLAYRTYLSPDAPREFPDLGPEDNARWADFMKWIEWSRVESVRQGMKMIRQVVPDKQIDLMAPGCYADQLRQLAKAYGGNFHNTGYMGSFWADDLPAIMRGAGLPFSLENGSPARDLQDFKKQVGRYMTEGIQGIDYFIHTGSILWNPEILACFQENHSLLKLIGKFHAPKADIAALYSTNNILLNSYPWGKDNNSNLGSGYWVWNVRANLRGLYESDALTDSSFADGDAAKYRVIIDTNTAIMDNDLVEEVSKFVANGGTFVTFAQTGRHTSQQSNIWPISKLSGYRVEKIDPLRLDGEPVGWRSLAIAPAQDVFTGDWSKARANGLTLKKVDPEAEDLMLWDDGSVAIGMRKLGKGAIIQVGCKFTGKAIPDRIDPPQSKEKSVNVSSVSANDSLTRLLEQILKWRGIHQTDARFQPDSSDVLVRHYISNNGLYDIWMMWNQSESQPVAGHVVIPDKSPTWAVDVRDGKRIAVTDGAIPAELAPLAIQAFVTPRKPLGEAPLEWFQLQRDWWQGATPVASQPPPKLSSRFSMDLQSDWAFKTLQEGEPAAPLVSPAFDDTTWARKDLGVWPDHPGASRRVLLRKKIVVPAEWKAGEITLWIQSWIIPTFFDRASVWIDGQLVAQSNTDGLKNLNLSGVLQPGKEIALAIFIEGKGAFLGCRGRAWLRYWPKSETKIDLGGDWIRRSNPLGDDDGAVTLPGSYDCWSLRRKISLPSELAGRNAVLDVSGPGQIIGVLVNGHWVRRIENALDPRFQLAITQWLRAGEDNEIELVNRNGFTTGIVSGISLEFYEPSTYP